MPARNPGIDTHQKEVSPALFEPAPYRSRFPPRLPRDLRAVLQVRIEYLSRLLSHPLALNAHHQLVIDLQTARVKVARAHIHGVVCDDQLGMQDLRLVLKGHTDNTGSFEKNLELSNKRVETVKAYLIGKGIIASRIEGSGYGSAQPNQVNRTEATKKSNRRVEVWAEPVKR